MKRTILQVPMSHELRITAEKVSSDMGFSSLQETIRVFLSKLSKKEITLKMDHENHLSPKAARRYEKMLDEMKQGKKVNSANNIEELMQQLNA